MCAIPSLVPGLAAQNNSRMFPNLSQQTAATSNSRLGLARLIRIVCNMSKYTVHMASQVHSVIAMGQTDPLALRQAAPQGPSTAAVACEGLHHAQSYHQTPTAQGLVTACHHQQSCRALHLVKRRMISRKDQHAYRIQYCEQQGYDDDAGRKS